MSLTETNGAPAPSEAIPAPTLPENTEAINAREAASAITAWRAKQFETAAQVEQSEKPRAPNGQFAPRTESAPQEQDAGPETVPGENVEADPAEELPPIEPPRSWSKEDKELFASLPRETQERVFERERSRESDFLRRQNEAAEKSKALEAKEQAAEQARQQYEQAAQNALNILQSQQAAEFADIKTDADVIKLATDDPFRFAQWQARQYAIQQQAEQVHKLNAERQTKDREQFEAWSKEQDSQFEKQFPEFSDKDKAGKAREGIMSYLTNEVGVPSDVLPKLWASDPLFRDHRMQRVVYDAMRWNAAQQKAKQAVATPKPPVQRPGTAPSKGPGLQEQIEAAQARLKNTRGDEAARAAVDLMRARRAAKAR